MSLSATSTSLSKIEDRIASYDYELIFTRNDDGKASADFYQYDSMGIASLLASAAVAAWDDATPWESGSYEASPRLGGLFKKPAWIISPNPANRDAIRLHVGSSSDNSEGCLVTDGAFLNTIQNAVGTQSFRVTVINDYPLSISLLSDFTSVLEGHTVELKIVLNQPVSKDMWVRVELDKFYAIDPVSTVGLFDLDILKDELVDLTGRANASSTAGQSFHGWYAHIAEGSTETTIKVKVSADSESEGTEKAKFVIVDYAISDDTKAGADTRFYADPRRLDIGPNDSVTLDIQDQQLPLVESGSSGRYPFTVRGAPGQEFIYTFDAYTIPDRLLITSGSETLVDTGVVSDSYTDKFKIPILTLDPEISVVVEGNSDPNTAWDLFIDVYDPSAPNIATTFHLSGHGRAEGAIEKLQTAPLVLSNFPSEGLIASAGDASDYSFGIAAGRTYLVTVEAVASRLDPLLYVDDSAGTQIGVFNDNVAGNGAFAFVTSTTQDTAKLTVAGENFTTGAFEVDAFDVTGKAKSLVYVSTNVDVIEESRAASSDDEVSSGGALSIYRDGDIGGTTVVQWRISPEGGTGASIADLDGVSSSGTVTFLAGEYIKSLNFTAIADGISETTEHFTFEILSANSAVFTGGVGEFGSKIGFDVVDTRELPMTKVGDVGPDVILGGSLADTLSGNFGDDMIDGRGGDDVMAGDFGVDTLIGGKGNDTLDGGLVFDPTTQGNFMLGGEGDDTYHVRNTFDLVDEGYVFADAGFGGNDTIVSHANWFWDVYGVGETVVVADDAADPTGAGVTFVGGVFDNTMIGHSGTDVLFGRGGSDTYRAGDGVDYISLSTLGVPDAANYTADGNNIVIVDPRKTGPSSYDIVYEFDPTKDKIDVSNYTGAHDYTSGAQVLAMAVDDGAGNCYIALGDGLDYLYLVGVVKAQLLTTDFIV